MDKYCTAKFLPLKYNNLSKMVEQQRQRVEQEMTKLINDLDRQFLRKMQGDMHRCAAKCCDDMTISLERVQSCVSNCSIPLNKSQGYIQQELEGFQNRLQRCVLECNDDIKLKMGPNPSDADINKYSLMFETCATKCVDKHVEMMPSIFKAMRTVLSQQQKDKVA